jgi:hypothetical protein
MSFNELRQAIVDLRAQCDGAPQHVYAPDDVKELFQRAADAGINAEDYDTLAECIAAIKALPKKNG